MHVTVLMGKERKQKIKYRVESDTTWKPYTAWSVKKDETLNYEHQTIKIVRGRIKKDIIYEDKENVTRGSNIKRIK